MSHDIVADTLNEIMNAKRAGIPRVTVKHHSKFLLSVLSIGTLGGYIKSFHVNGRELDIELGDKLNACLAIKPRYLVAARDIMKYARRYLPSRTMGVVILSTSQGLMTHQTSVQKNIGGSIIAYFY